MSMIDYEGLKKETGGRRKLLKKVIAINSSKRKKRTYSLLQQMKDKLKKENIKVDIINLSDYKIEQCIGCEMCLRNNECKINDDVKTLMDLLKEYDGIILSTPVYMNNVCGRLKVFVDRTCKWMHRPELVAVPIMFVVTTAGSGAKRTLEYLENISLQWGTFATDKIYRKARTLSIPIILKEYKSFVKHIFMSKNFYRPSINQLIQFQVQKVLADKILIIDKEYWKMKGWMYKDYFFDADISLVNLVVSKIFYKFLSSRIRKVEQ